MLFVIIQFTSLLYDDDDDDVIVCNCHVSFTSSRISASHERSYDMMQLCRIYIYMYTVYVHIYIYK